MFTQRHAEVIATKLGCTFREAKNHRYAEYFEQGKLVIRFGIRRASRQIPHYYIPREMYLKQKECQDFHDCTLTKDEYLAILRERGKL